MPNYGTGPTSNTNPGTTYRGFKMPPVMPAKIIVSPEWEPGARYVFEDSSSIFELYSKFAKDNSKSAVKKALNQHYDVKLLKDFGGQAVSNIIKDSDLYGLYPVSGQEVFAYHTTYPARLSNRKVRKDNEQFVIISIFPNSVSSLENLKN